jgi:hypothetical protein
MNARNRVMEKPPSHHRVRSSHCHMQHQTVHRPDLVVYTRIIAQSSSLGVLPSASLLAGRALHAWRWSAGRHDTAGRTSEMHALQGGSAHGMLSMGCLAKFPSRVAHCSQYHTLGNKPGCDCALQIQGVMETHLQYVWAKQHSVRHGQCQANNGQLHAHHSWSVSGASWWPSGRGCTCNDQDDHASGSHRFRVQGHTSSVAIHSPMAVCVLPETHRKRAIVFKTISFASGQAPGPMQTLPGPQGGGGGGCETLSARVCQKQWLHGQSKMVL